MAAALAFPTMPIFVFLLIIISLLSHQFHLIFANATTGFSLKLIHRDSPESPLYPGNLSSFDQIQRLIDFSETRYLELQTRATKTIPIDDLHPDLHPDVIRPRVKRLGFLYFVQVKIGTPSKPYYLLLDTGSSIVWIQCEPCEMCFDQRNPTFVTSSSSSYSTLPCGHPMSRAIGGRCIGDSWIYTYRYGTGQTTNGVLSNETFTFESNTGVAERKTGIVFGCSNNNQNFDDFEGDGILGMSYATPSLMIQIRSELGNKQRFSYCLVDPRVRGTSFLRFGNDNIRPPRGVPIQATPFLGDYRDPTMYAVNLLDISVENNRIGFEPGTFASKSDGTGGCVMDSGSSITFMDNDPYGILSSAVMHYFEQYQLQRVRYNLDLCYRLPRGFNNFPSLTFHFQNADLTVMPENTFLINNQDRVFCFAMKPKNGTTLIGAMQQQNTRFVYDIGRGLLQFVPEDCSQDVQ